MTTTNKLRGKHFGIYNYTTDSNVKWLALSTSATLDIDIDMQEVCSTDGRGKSYKPGRYSWSVSADGIVSLYMDRAADEQPQIAQYIDALKVGQTINMAIAHLEVVDGEASLFSDFGYCGTAIVKSISIVGDVQGHAKYNIVLQGSGDLIPLHATS